MTDTIFRFTNPGDTINNVDPTEKIQFNTGTIPDSTGRLVKPSFRMVSDLNPHPNPNRALNKIQDSLLGVVEVVIAGYFIDHNNTLGPRNLYNWSIEEDINADFRGGRFGLEIAAFNGLLSVVPTIGFNGTGYMLAEIDVQDIEDPRTEVSFTAKFFRNGSISTVS